MFHALFQVKIFTAKEIIKVKLNNKAFFLCVNRNKLNYYLEQEKTINFNFKKIY